MCSTPQIYTIFICQVDLNKAGQVEMRGLYEQVCMIHCKILQRQVIEQYVLYDPTLKIHIVNEVSLNTPIHIVFE